MHVLAKVEKCPECSRKARRRREDETVQLRKAKRDEQLTHAEIQKSRSLASQLLQTTAPPVLAAVTVARLASKIETIPNGDPREIIIQQTCQGLFSDVSKLILQVLVNTWKSHPFYNSN